jgi:hypothetical protein
MGAFMRKPTLSIVLGSLSLAATACGGASGGDIGTTTSAVSAPSAAEKTAYEFFIGKGLKNFQAAGIVGNLEQESSLDPTVYQYGGGPGRGIAQWSAGGRWDSDGGDNVVWYAHKEGESEWSLTLQLEFVWYELETFSGYGLSSLRGSGDVRDATVVFQDRFEGCGECDQSTRIAYAESVLDAFGNENAPKPTPIPKQAADCGVIHEGEGLKSGESLLSCDGRYELAMQDDGNLVWYGPKGALWASGTDGKGGHVAVVQSDGNFVLYNSDSGALWASDTSGHGGDHLSLQDDGNLVVYGSAGAVLWASHTEQAAPPPPPPCGTLASGKSLSKGESVSSCSGGYSFVMQTDGNVVEYDSAHKPLWASNTEGTGDRVDMQTDGNLVVYTAENKPVWNAVTQGHPGAYFAVQGDSNIVVYSDAGKALWARFGL